MTETLSSIFGGKPKKPAIVKQEPIEKVTQNVKDTEKQAVLTELAKQRRATLISQLSDPNVRKRTLGVG